MKFSLRDLLLVTVILGGCGAPDVIDDNVKNRLRSTSEVRFVLFGLQDDGIPDGFAVTLDDPKDIAECVETLTKQRDWKPWRGHVTADWGSKISFMDAGGSELWRCDTVGAGINCESADGKKWNAIWRDWVKWTEDITDAKNRAKEAGKSPRVDSPSGDSPS